MFETLDDQRHANGQEAAPRAFPVLFHLMDVSRPRPMPPAQQHHTPATAPVAETAVTAKIETPLPAILAPPLPETNVSISHSSNSAALSMLSRPLLEASPLAESPSSGSERPAATAFSRPSADNAESSPPLSSAAAEPARPAAAEPPPTTPNFSQAVTPRSHSNSRRKTKTPASEDWFASHGKFIAIAFVLALIGTVYFARTNRRKDDGAAAIAAQPTSRSSSQAIDSSVKASGDGASASSSRLAEAKPANAVESGAATADAKVDLHPPADVQLVSDTGAGTKPKSSDNLFVFPQSKAADDRVASRADATLPANSAASLQTGLPSPANALSPNAAPATPSSQPGYPVTSPANTSATPPAASAGPASYPVTSAPPLLAPTSPAVPARSSVPAAGGPASEMQPQFNPAPNYRSQFPMPAGPTAQQPPAWSPPGPSSGLPGPSYPSNNTARGPRYERTGSGNY